MAKLNWIQVSEPSMMSTRVNKTYAKIQDLTVVLFTQGFETVAVMLANTETRTRFLRLKDTRFRVEAIGRHAPNNLCLGGRC